MKNLNFTLIIIISFFYFSSFAGMSALRFEDESYEQAWIRNITEFKISAVQDESLDQFFNRYHKGFKTAFQSKKKLNDLNFDEITQLKNLAEAKVFFEYIRDTQFIKSNKLKFPRRISWLYPDDGCFARAELMSKFLGNKFQIEPLKVFAFGDLVAVSNFHPAGKVTWWYHVAVIFKSNNELIVFDPSLELNRFLSFHEWNSLIGGDRQELEFSICKAGTYDPEDDCQRNEHIDFNTVFDDQIGFLNHEWFRMLELDRNPVRDLGDFPPWKN